MAPHSFSLDVDEEDSLRIYATTAAPYSEHTSTQWKLPVWLINEYVTHLVYNIQLCIHELHTFQRIIATYFISCTEGGI